MALRTVGFASGSLTRRLTRLRTVTSSLPNPENLCNLPQWVYETFTSHAALRSSYIDEFRENLRVTHTSIEVHPRLFHRAIKSAP